MNILVLNQDWFVEEWRAAGHSVYSCGFSTHLDFPILLPLLHIESIIEQLPGGIRPDVIVCFDNSSPIVFSGLDETEIPTLFYAVDTHHHINLHRYLSHLFDYTLTAQKDFIPQFESVGVQVEWMPLWASRYIEPSQDKKHGAVFVGNLDVKLNADRVAFFEALQQKTQVFTTIGKYWEIFPYSEIVLNQTVKGDLNFRVFEAMMSGAMLLTEDSGNGLTELFTPGVHLATYKKGNVDEAAELIEYYRSNPKLCAEIAARGREEILSKHSSQHRADRLLEIMKNLGKRKSNKKFFAAMANFAILGLRSEKIDSVVGAKCFLAAMKCMEYAVNEKNELDQQLACFAIYACHKYDQHIGTGAGSQALFKLAEAFPEENVLKIAKIRTLLNQGERNLAEQLARQTFDGEATIIFQRAEEFVGLILNGESFG